MIRISLPFICNSVLQMDTLNTLPTGPAKFGDIIYQIYTAQTALNTLTTGSVFSPYLVSSRELANRLKSLIDAQASEAGGVDREVGGLEIWQIKNAYTEYKVALFAEIGTLASYFVTQKGPYDTAALLSFGEVLFPLEIVSKVPEAVHDARQAGLCLAYELPTAAGFHTFRVLEAVLRRYYAHETGGMAPPKVRNIGVYINAMKQAQKGDAKVLAAVKQMADLHRNPLVHPEVILTTEEAMTAFGIARSAVAAMLTSLPVIPPTTQTAPINALVSPSAAGA